MDCSESVLKSHDENFIIEQMGTLGEITSSSTKAFTDTPDF